MNSNIKQQSCAASAAHILKDPGLSAWLEGHMSDPPKESEVAFNIRGLVRKSAMLSSGEQVLVQVAHALYTETNGPPLVSMMRTLDDSSLRRCLDAMIALRPKAAPASVQSYDSVMGDERVKGALEAYQAILREWSFTHKMTDAIDRDNARAKAYEIIGRVLTGDMLDDADGDHVVQV